MRFSQSGIVGKSGMTHGVVLPRVRTASKLNAGSKMAGTARFPSVSRVARSARGQSRSSPINHKRLWLETYEAELSEATNESAGAILEVGHSVGELARNRYPGGTLMVKRCGCIS